MPQQFLRRVVVQGPTTITGGRDGDLRIQFRVNMWHSGTSNMCSITVTNPSPATVTAWKNKVGTVITLSAGYDNSRIGVIFRGEIKQVEAGHNDNYVDTFLIIYCADSDQFYRKAIVTKTLGRGHTPQDKVNVALEAMAPFDVTMGTSTLDLSKPVYPRGTGLIGMARDLLRQVTVSAGGLWSVQDGKLMMTGADLDNGNSSTVKLTSATGLVSYPTETEDGITFRSLLNPALRPLMKVELDPSQIIRAERDNNSFSGGGASERNNILRLQNAGAGVYAIYRMDRVGDTRGNDFYDECFSIGQGGTPSPSVNANLYHIGSQ